jgi:peptide/nickel transport system substrate-binding protein
MAIPSTYIDSVDPAIAALPGDFPVLEPTCAGLLNTPDKPLPAGLRFVPEIAADYPAITNGGKTYTFKVRKDFRFSTGKRVTARDFAYTINRLLSPVLKSPLAGDLTPIVGAPDVIDGKAKTASGVIAKRDTLTIKLTKPLGTFEGQLAADICVEPEGLPVDPEGAKAPIPAAGPYYVAEYIPGESIVLERNRFYRGERPHHIDHFVIDLTLDAASILDRVDAGTLDFGWVSNGDYAARADAFKQKYGVNRARFFVEPDTFLRMFVLNTARPLFRNNVSLRQAVNFAIDRKAVQRERGGTLTGTLTDQFLPPGLPAYRNENIYPLRVPNVVRAKALARGHTRSRKAVLYAPTIPVGVAQAQIVQRDLKRIGLDVEVKQFPPPVLFEKLATPGEPFDIGWIGWDFGNDPAYVLSWLFDGRTIANAPDFGDWSYFNSSRYDRLLDRASKLPIGQARDLAYRRLDIQLSRDAAPAVAFSYDNRLTLVGPRTGCVIVKPGLDLAAVCLK